MSEEPFEILQTINIRKSYGVSIFKEGTTALTSASLTLVKGECCGLVGPNGAGKSTLIKVITGIEQSYTGDVIFARGVRIGYVPERPTFYESLSAFDNLLYFAKLAGCPNPKERIEELLRDFGLSLRKQDEVNEYSKGMRQRLAIARSIICSPELLILDEPFSGLDPSMTMDLKERLITMKSSGITMLISSHNLSEVQAICDNVAFLKKGTVVMKVSTKRKTDSSIVRIRVSNGYQPSSEIQEDVVSQIHGHCFDLRIDRSEITKMILALIAEGASIEGVELIENDIEELYRSIFKEDESAQE